MNYYPRNIGDWRTATWNLTKVQRCIYSDLIDTYYDKERPLTADLAMLAEDHNCRSLEEREALQYILKRYFRLEGSVYRHDRCDEEITHFHHITDVAVKAGRASASARAERKRNGRSTPVEARVTTFSSSVAADRGVGDESRIAPTLNERPLDDRSVSAAKDDEFAERLFNAAPTDGQLPKTQDPITSPSGEVRESTREIAPAPPPHITTPPPEVKQRRPSKRCPADFEVTSLMVQWAMQEEQLPLEVIERETKTFRDHTFGRTITDWVATWRNWMRKAASFSNHRSHHKGGIGATLDKQAQTKSFIAAVKGDANGAGFKDTFDVESRVIRRDEEPPLDPGP